MILELGTAILRAIELDLQLINLLSQHIHLFIGLFELALHDHLLSFSLLYIVTHLLVHILELFDALDYKQFKIFFDTSDVSDLSFQGIDFVLVGVYLFLEGVVFSVFLIAALNVPPDLPSVLLTIISLQFFDVVLKLFNQFAFIVEQGLIVGSFMCELSREQVSFSLSFHQNGPR